MPAAGLRALLPILAVQFVGALGLSVVLPFLITVVLDFGGNAVAYGVIGATYAAFQLVGAPWLGRLSDRVGRRRILLVSQAGTLLAWGLFAVAFFLPLETLAEFGGGGAGAFALTLPLLVIFLARALDGLTGGNVSVATAYLADRSTAQTRKRNFGYLSAATSLGYIVGPAFAGLVAEVPLMGRANLLPIALAGLISAVALALIYFGLERDEGLGVEELRGERLRDQGSADQGSKDEGSEDMTAGGSLSLKQALRLPDVPRLLALYFLLYLGFNFFYVAFPVFATEGMAWSTLRLGVFFSVLSAVLVAVEGPLVGVLSDRVDDRRLYLVGGVVLAAGFASMTVLRDGGLYVSAALFGLGNGLMWPSFVSLLAAAAGDRYQGAVQGLGASFGSAAAIVGMLAGGVAYGALEANVFWVSAAAIGAAALGLLKAPRTAGAQER